MNIEEYNKTKDEVDKIVAEMVAEFNKVINALQKDNSIIRIRLLLPFIFAEIVCTNFDKYYNLNLSNKDLMEKWFLEYCLTNRNETYYNHPYFKRIDNEYLYQLRCSLVHAFALPEKYNNSEIAVMFVNGKETAQNIKEIDKKFSKAGHTPVFISPDSLMALIMKGTILLHEEIFIDENKATQENFEGLKRMLKEFHRRGACLIPLEH